MVKLLGLVGATAGGWLAWWLGARIGLMTGFFASMLGSGVGWYAGKRLAARLLD